MYICVYFDPQEWVMLSTDPTRLPWYQWGLPGVCMDMVSDVKWVNLVRMWTGSAVRSEDVPHWLAMK